MRRRLRPGEAQRAFEQSRRTTELARATGTPLDEAAGVLAERLDRRRLLRAAGLIGGAVALPAVAPLPAAAEPSPHAAKAAPKVVIVGAGIAGLGCALRLRHRYGIHAEVYEWDDRPGGRIRTLRGHFADRQLVEEHAEFINPEHTHTLALARRLGLRLDNTDHYPVPDGDQLTLRFGGKSWSQRALDHDWHTFGRQLFLDAARQAPFPTTYSHSTKAGRTFDHQSVLEWLDANVPGGSASDFGQLCISAVLDEYGGAAHEQSALNLIYLLGGDASTKTGKQPKSAPVLGGGDERWHITGGTDLLISGILGRIPDQSVHYGERLVAVRPRGHGRYSLVFHDGHRHRTVAADHVVLALPFTTLRDVELQHVDIGHRHRRAIREEPLGSNAKFFLQFSDRVWDDADETGNAYCRGVVQGSWDATGYQPGKAGILAALPGGATAADWGSTYRLTDYRGPAPKRMVKDYLHAFDGLFPGAEAAYNGKSFYVWSSGDPHSKGAYSYLKVGQYTAFNGIQGRREGNLHFAGEHTSTGYQGYIEGGLRSGERCADEIAHGRR